MSQIRMREYDARRDLDGLYDLAEVAYAEDYGRIGRPAKAGMDRERRIVALLSVLERALPRLRDVQPGFVCEAGGKLVSIVLFARVGLVGDRWSIETVATHPDHRRQGLASALLKRAIESIRGRGGRLCTLKVRSDNEEAYGLYRSLGFQHYDTTVHVKLDRGIPAEIPRPDLEAYDARAVSTKVWFGSWRERHDLAVRETPDDVQRMIPLSPAQFRRPAFFPYLAPVVTRLAGQRVERHLVVYGGRLVATLAVSADVTGERTHEFSLVIDPAHDVPLASGLVAKALAALGRDPKLLVLTEVRPTRATTIQVLESRGFEEISRWHWLGLRLDCPSWGSASAPLPSSEAFAKAPFARSLRRAPSFESTT